jgi:hypothetical protein
LGFVILEFGFKVFCQYSPDRLEVLVRVLELALHNRKHNLQDGLVKEYLQGAKEHP